MKEFKPGDCLNLAMELKISFSEYANVDEDELKMAIDTFIRKWIEENYVCKN